LHPEAEVEVFGDLLRSNLQGICELSTEQVHSLYDHYQILSRWNQVLNLSSVRDLETAVVRHYCESVFLAVNMPEVALSIADLGSGGGFPGIPLAAMRPDCNVTLIEAHQRKAAFLKEATRAYKNVRIIAKRSEQAEGPFDWLVSRAVAWEDVRKSVPKLARNLALLTSRKNAEGILTVRDVLWAPPLQLPWGQNHILLRGTIVSRGTC
jgi:16S rRNA (guanine(527)-N(7))-methyltransferase RsmG